MKNGSRDRSKAMEYSKLTLNDFARLFGTSISNIPPDCRELINGHDFSYRTLTGTERDKVLLGVLQRIDNDQFSLAGKEGKERWEKGWAQNRDSFIKEAGNPAHLVPKYIRPNQPLRIDQCYVEANDTDFELNWVEVFRNWLFQTYLADFGSIYEFGCGSCFNLALLAKMYPNKRLYGLDWATSSVDIANEMGKIHGWNISGSVFDFFAPDQNIRIDKDSAILTFGALEQTGTDYKDFLQYILDSSPKLCVHVEPMLEWYDDKNLVDYAAIRFHEKRNYWRGFEAKLKELESDGKVEILKSKRSYFGSLYIEGYSQLIWRPTI